jgi:hypothetical protein
MLRLGMKKVEGGDFAHPETDPQSIHVLYVAERGSRQPANL